LHHEEHHLGEGRHLGGAIGDPLGEVGEVRGAVREGMFGVEELKQGLVEISG
jgi:hypothetical protein